MNNFISIMKAKNGGYLVFEFSKEINYDGVRDRIILFCGTIDECLEYIKNFMKDE